MCVGERGQKKGVIGKIDLPHLSQAHTSFFTNNTIYADVTLHNSHPLSCGITESKIQVLIAYASFHGTTGGNTLSVPICIKYIGVHHLNDRDNHSHKQVL